MAKYDPNEDMTTAPQDYEPTISAIPVYWKPPICNPNPAGPIKVFYYNGFLYWDYETSNEKFNVQFSGHNYPSDLNLTMQRFIFGPLMSGKQKVGTQTVAGRIQD